MKVVVVGGTGHLGALAVEALRRLEVDVTVASRRGPLRVDLADPSTFVALAGFEVVVDLADATTTPPDALARWCVEHGVTLLEATSDREAVERILDAKLEGPGAVVLGAGIFTGLSNLLARSIVEPGTRALELAIASSPYSGAGKGTIALMIAALAQSTRSVVDGTATLGPPVARGPRFDFPSGQAPSLHVSLAEPRMIHRSTGVPTVRAYLSPRPSLLVAMFLAMPTWLLSKGWFRAMLGGYFTFLRRFVLRAVSTRVEMVVRADGRTRSLVARDGMLTAGAAIAAITARLPKVEGVRMVDEVVGLAEILETMKPHPGGEVNVR